MSRFSEEMKLIPRPAWAVAVVLGLAFLGGLFLYGIFEVDNGSVFEFGPFLAVLMAAFAVVMFSVFVLLVGYIYADARRRGMRPVLWALLAFFIPNAIGVLLYFILREPLLTTCPRCGAGTKPSFPFCPACGASIANSCPSCRSTIEPGWSHCAKCGAQLTAAHVNS